MRNIQIIVFLAVFGFFTNQAAFASLSLDCAEPTSNQAIFNLHFDTPTQVSLSTGAQVAASYVFDPASTTEGFVAYRSAQGGEIKIARDLTHGPGRRAPVWVENGRTGGAYVCDSALINE